MIGAIALIEPGTGEVKALAQSRALGKEPGQTFLNYTVPKEYGKANGFQPGSTFKTFVLAAAINQGIPLNKTYNVRAAGVHPGERVRDLRRPLPELRTSWSFDELRLRPAHGQPLHRHPGLGEHLLRRAGDRDRPLRALQPRRAARRPARRARKTEMVPSFTLGIPDTSPLELAEAYATFAARGKHCDALPVLKIEDNRGQRAQGLQAEVHPGAPEPGRRRGQRHPRGRDRARWLRRGPVPRSAGRRQDRYVDVPTSRSGSPATRPTSRAPSPWPASTRSATPSRWTAR